MDRYAIIMAGGEGTRFWPLSRYNMPKQFLNISGNDLMINEAIKRLIDIIPLKNIYVVINKNQSCNIEHLIINEFPRENILYEPVGRNTAACITYAAMVISRRGSDSVMYIFPSDHYISDEDKFRQIMNKAYTVAQNTKKLITIGISPTFPSSGYGYIRFNHGTYEIEGAYDVDSFVEKPSVEKAREYIESGEYLWNSGMFVWKVSTILDNVHRYLPRLFKSMIKIQEDLGTDREQKTLEKIYPELQSISIDFGVLERSDNILVIPGDFGWNDVGSWDALGTIFPTDENGNIVKAKHISLNTKNSIIYSGNRLIATIGIDNLIVVDTEDALLICPKDRAQEVKSIVQLIRKNGLEEYI